MKLLAPAQERAHIACERVRRFLRHVVKAGTAAHAAKSG